MTANTKQEKRKWRHARVRAKLSGTLARPRLVVFKSNTRVSAQLIDDEAGKTIASGSTHNQKGKSMHEKLTLVANHLAKEAQKNNIEAVVFDHGGFGYRGVIRLFAESARSAGLKF